VTARKVVKVRSLTPFPRQIQQVDDLNSIKSEDIPVVVYAHC
jgi:hypothetical protein